MSNQSMITMLVTEVQTEEGTVIVNATSAETGELYGMGADLSAALHDLQRGAIANALIKPDDVVIDMCSVDY